MKTTTGKRTKKISRDEIAKFLLTKGTGLMAEVVDRIKVFFENAVFPVLIIGESGSGKEFVARVLLSDGKDFGSSS